MVWAFARFHPWVVGPAGRQFARLERIPGFVRVIRLALRLRLAGSSAFFFVRVSRPRGIVHGERTGRDRRRQIAAPRAPPRPPPPGFAAPPPGPVPPQTPPPTLVK